MSICVCAPFNPKHSQKEEDVRAKYNTSRKPNSLPVVVIVETEIIAPGGIVAPGQGNKKTARFCEDWKRAAWSPVGIN